MTESDARLQRGARSRRVVTRHAVDIASLDGLDGISFGRLADELEISKAGIQTLFRTKENLQLATAETAGEVFAEAVVRPALTGPPGIPRFHALIEHWMDYATRPLFPGGCFWSANLPEVDSRPGPVRDLLTGQHRVWLETMALPLAPREDRADLVFQVDAILSATNIALRLGDRAVVDRARRTIDRLVPAH